MQSTQDVIKVCAHTTIISSCPACQDYQHEIARSATDKISVGDAPTEREPTLSSVASASKGTRMKADSIPSIKSLREKAAKKQTEQHWNRLIRKASIYITWLLLHTPISANGVTFLFLLSGLVGGAVFVLGTHAAWIVGTLFIWLSIFFDFSDGEVARFRQESSWFGDYFEETVHAVLLIAMYTGISFGLWRTMPTNPWPFIAALAAMGFTMIIRNDKNLMLKSKLQYYGAERFINIMQNTSAKDLSVTRNMGRLLYYVDLVIFDFGFYFIVLPLAALTNRMDWFLYFCGLTRLVAAVYLFFQSWKQRQPTISKEA